MNEHVQKNYMVPTYLNQTGDPPVSMVASKCLMEREIMTLLFFFVPYITNSVLFIIVS